MSECVVIEFEIDSRCVADPHLTEQLIDAIRSAVDARAIEIRPIPLYEDED